MFFLCFPISSWAYQRNRGATAVHSVSPHPHPLVLSPSPSSTPHISTFQHTDTVTARPDFHSEAHGQWADLPASRWPYAPLWFSHSCTMTNWDYYTVCAVVGNILQACRGIHAYRKYPVSVIYMHDRCEILKRALWFVSLFVLSGVFSEGVCSVYTMLMHLGFPAATSDLSRKSAQYVRNREQKNLFII